MRDRWQATLRLAAGALTLSALLLALHTSASDPTTGAILGIAGQTTAGTVQECRTLSADELAALPAHMRRSQECTSHAVRYRLEVEVGGVRRLDRVYVPAGLRGDRPIALAERVGVPPGTHAVRIRFAPETEAADQQLPRFALDETVTFADGRIRIAQLGGGGFEIR